MPPRWDRLADSLQVKRHGLRISIRQHQTDSRISLRTYGTKDVGRFGLPLPHDSQPCSCARQDTRLGTSLANAHLVLKPLIDLRQPDFRRQNGLYLLDQVFLNSACLAGLSFGLAERADIQAMSSRLSDS